MIPIDRRCGEGVVIGLFTRLRVLDTSPGEACIQIEAYPEGAQIALSGRYHVFGAGCDTRLDTARGQPVVIWQSRMTSICIAGCIYCALTNVKRGAVELVLQAPRTLVIDRCERRHYVTSTAAGHFQVGHNLFWFEGRRDQLILFRGQLAQWDDTDPVRGWLAEVTVGSMASIVNPPLTDMGLAEELWSPCPAGAEPRQLSALQIFSSAEDALAGFCQYLDAFRTFRPIEPESSRRRRTDVHQPMRVD